MLISQGLTGLNPPMALQSAIDSFSNPEVLAVIAKLQKAEIRLCPFSEPSNSVGALAPPLSMPLLHEMFYRQIF